MSCLYFYKLNSEYPCDVSKQCKLTVNEIDNNFYQLKGDDIIAAELDAENYAVVLTRNNGDKLVVDLTPILSGAVYDLDVVYENPSKGDPESCNGANVYVTYSTLTSGDVKTTVTVPITGLVTTENVDSVLGGGLLSEVTTDGSLKGNGTIDSPLGIKDTEKNRPAVKLIDKTVGEELPETFTKGTRYITKEYVSEFGYLYNYHAAEQIQEQLDAEGRGWRIPTKADWDCLLNSVEPCDYRDHGSAMCHQILGKYAGAKLKSACGWLEQPDCECKITKPLSGQCGSGETSGTSGDFSGGTFEPGTSVISGSDVNPEEVRAPYWGTDDFGMRILPTGYGDGNEIEHYFGKSTVFWTSTHVYNDLSQDLYVKKFDWDKSGVVQEADCPDALFAIRLVKDYTGKNHEETETIDGLNYSTILFPDCGTVWTASNFAGTKYPHVEANMGLNPYNRVAYFINVWNGTSWDKRALEEGETVVIMEGNPDCQYNIEYRVYTGEDCNQELVNADDTVVERVLAKVTPLIDAEKQERIDADNFLSGAIDTEREERIAADEVLQEQIDAEVLRAKEVEQQLWDGLNLEREAREEVDNQIWDALNNEITGRLQVDADMWNAINAEASARTDVDNQLWDAINNEAAARTDVDNQLWNAINAEASARTDVDNQLWDAINNEAAAREEVDNQLWTALNNEINDRIADVDEEEARAKAEEERIECQIIDNPADPKNDNTAALGENGYVMHVVNGMTLYSKCGTNDIPIKFDADFGTF